MIALGLDNAEEFAEALYLARITVNGHRTGTRRWQDLAAKRRRRWVKTAERVMQLYSAEGLTAGFPPSAGTAPHDP